MKLSERVLEELARMVVGDAKQFPYRSSHFITRFFGRCGLPFVHDGTTRPKWARERLAELNLGTAQSADLPSDDLCRVISELFDPDDFDRHNDKAPNSEYRVDVRLALASFNQLVQRAGLIAYLDESGRCYLRSTGTGISSASFSQQTRPLSQDEIVQRQKLADFLDKASEDEFTDLLKASATQVTGFAKAANGGLYVSTSNLGKVFLLGGSPETEGTYESDVFDAHIYSRWGRAETRTIGNVDLFARSGNVDNPDRNWSSWTKVDLQKDAQLNVPLARFVQWKTVLHAGNPAPRLDSVTLNYLSRNVAPDFDDVTIQPGVRYQSVPKSSASDISISTSAAGNLPQIRFDPPPITQHDSDSIGVKWTVHDDNDDQMVYSIYYRGEGEKRWLLLKDKITDKFYAFDASLLPDGGYTVKIVASDAPSHSPGDALTSEKESARFEVDSTPPRIEALNAVTETAQLHVTFRATDSFSPIDHAEYSVDAGDWHFIEPAGQLSDSKTESYDFKLPLAAAGSDTDEHVVVVRVYDRYDNMSSAKAVIRGK